MKNVHDLTDLKLYFYAAKDRYTEVVDRGGCKCSRSGICSKLYEWKCAPENTCDLDDDCLSSSDLEFGDVCECQIKQHDKINIESTSNNLHQLDQTLCSCYKEIS